MHRLNIYFLGLLFVMGCTCINAQVDSIPVKPDKSPSPVSDNSNITIPLLNTLDSVFIVRRIYFVGNKKTRDVIMLRELPFKEGDSINIHQIPDLFERGKTQLLNTSLFTINDFSISIKQFEGKYMDIQIVVKERWYLLPLPYLRPVDRNLNQWLFEKGANTGRLDYGVKVSYHNVTGNNDKLRFYFITGYTRQLRLSYSRPYIDKQLKWGTSIDLSLGKTHELNYNTSNDKQVFLSTHDDFTRNFFKGSFELTYRPAFFTRHFFGIGYQTLRISDTIFKLNPNYLANGAKQVRFPELYYRLVYQNLDYIPYPTQGYAAEIYLGKQGFTRNMNVWVLNAKGLGNWHLNPKMFYSLGAQGTIKLPFKQPYSNTQLMGYGDFFMRGYEYYVMDGVAGGLVNATLSRQLANFSLYLPFLKRFTARLIPLKIYGKVYGNTGYVHNPNPGNNYLTNRMLYGGGFGLDIFTDYDFTFKLEFSFNQLGQNGLYLHKKTIF